MLVPFPAASERFPSATTRRRALWLVLDLEAKKRGSLEEQLFALGRRLHQAAIEATFVFQTDPPPWMRQELAAANVTVRVLPVRPAWPAAWTLWSWLVADPPALVHFHFVPASSPVVAAARLAGARVVLHDHMALGYAFAPARRRARVEAALVRAYKRARGALVHPLVDTRIAVSEFVARSLVAADFVPKERIVVLEHGVDLGRFANADGRAVRAELGAGDRPVIGCISRMAPEKGVDVLLRAHARLGRDVVLALAGDGPDEGRCRALAAALGAGDRVRFLGLRRDVGAVLAACDVAVVPSTAPEAFGLAVVEAMAAGKPVVVSDAGAMPDVVDGGRCGSVVPAGDADALAAALGRLLDGPVFARALGDAGRRRALARYGLDAWVQRLLEIYATVAPALGAAPAATERRVVA